MEPLFLILGCLVYGYPEEALRVFGIYLGWLILRSMVRESRYHRGR